MEKRSAVGGDVGEGSVWAEMAPEVMALIMSRLVADELSRAVPFVCRAWSDAAAGPYFWAEIELEGWCRRVNRSDVVDAAIRKLVRRSQGNLRRLSAYRIGNSGFDYIAGSGKFLKVLQIPTSLVSDQVVHRYEKSFPNLEVLDISFCLDITMNGIKVLGRHCPCLIKLRRNMPPFIVDTVNGTNVAASVEEGEALAVAETMRMLEHLELCYARFSDKGLTEILNNCKALRHLDIGGCQHVIMAGDIQDKCELIQCFRDPWEEFATTDSGEDDSVVYVSSDDN